MLGMNGKQAAEWGTKGNHIQDAEVVEWTFSCRVGYCCCSWASGMVYEVDNSCFNISGTAASLLRGKCGSRPVIACKQKKNRERIR